MMPERRTEKRYVSIHTLSVNRESQFGLGKIVDWSNHGIKVSSSIPIDSAIDLLVRLHIEKDEGLMGVAQRWDCEGHIQWVWKDEHEWQVGIRFMQELTPIPLERMDRFLNENVQCYLFISYANQTVKEVPLE